MEELEGGGAASLALSGAIYEMEGKFMKKFFTILCLAMTSVAMAKTFTVFVLTGQSNSLGAIKGNFASFDNLLPTPRVKFWHNNFGKYCTGEDSVSWEYVFPQFESEIVMGPEYGFSQELQSFYKSIGDESIEDIGIIKASRDGGGNSNWIKGQGDAYTIVLDTIKMALSQLPEKGYNEVRFAGLLYLQGESDKGEEITSSSVRLLDFVKNIKEDILNINISGLEISTEKMLVLLGEHASWNGEDRTFNGETTRDNLYKTSLLREDIIWIPSRDLNKIAKGDNLGVHYDGDSQLILGRRFARAWIDAQ